MGTITIDGQIREATCRQELNAMRDSLELLGGKWRLVILRYLSNRVNEKNTFKKMQREINGISAKMLTGELRILEENLLLTRAILDTRPVSVAYFISDYGKSVLPVAEELVQWGLDHRAHISKK